MLSNLIRQDYPVISFFSDTKCAVAWTADLCNQYCFADIYSSMQPNSCAFLGQMHTSFQTHNASTKNMCFFFVSFRFPQVLYICCVFASKCVTFTSESPFDRPFFQASKADH